MHSKQANKQGEQASKQASKRACHAMLWEVLAGSDRYPGAGEELAQEPQGYTHSSAGLHVSS
jgi:hypothetical protein